MERCAVSCRVAFDIQFFAQERTEPATPRKREKVRSEGRVCMSKTTDRKSVV